MNQVIIAPIVTEKSTNAQEDSKYTFWVRSDANKIEVAKAVKENYGKDVASVRIMIAPKKVRMLRYKHEMVKRPKIKKAIVTLKNGENLDVNDVKKVKSDK